MAAKGYSAGAIFLQVVPVFANVQKAIEDEAKNIDRALGDQMEKSGEKAGERAGKAASKAMEDEVAKTSRKISAEMEREFQRGLEGMNKALGDIKTRDLGKKLRAEVKEMRAELESLSDVDLKVDDNFEKVAAKVAALRKQVEDMRSRSKVFFDIKGLPEVYRKIHQVEKAIQGVNATVEVKADTKAAQREIGAFEKAFKKSAASAAKALSGSVSKEARKLRDELKYLENLRIGVDISGNQARRELSEIERDLQRLAMESADIDVKVDTAAALAELAAFRSELDNIERPRRVDVDTSSVRQAGRDANDAANTFRSFNIYILAATSVGPGLVPVLGAIAGGLLAIGPAGAVAVAGLGSVLVGFSGLSDALSALQAQEDQAAMTAQTAAKQRVSASNAVADATEALSDAHRRAARAEEDAAERVADAVQSLADARRRAAEAEEDAAEAVADARERAAEAIEAALERQQDAQEAYRDSVNEVREAEQALREARREAADDGEEIARQIEENQLAIEQGLLDAFHAEVEYRALQSDGSATNAEQEQARINMERARLDLANLRDEQEDLNKAKKKWDKDGVNGTEQVQTAQERLNNEVESQRDAYERLQKAAENVDEARRDGAEMVADALENQNEVLADNARAIADARKALARAQEDQTETFEDNARAIEDARQALARARQGQDDLNNSINAQQQAVDNAMAALGPAGRRFVLYLRSLRDEWHAFRDDIQQAMLPDVQVAMEGFFSSKNASVAREAMIALAEAFGRFVRALSVSLQGPAWGAFFQMLADLGPQIADAYGGAFIKFMEAMASIMTTLAPYALLFAEGFERLMTAFADWAASKEGQEAITNFMDWVVANAPMVLDFLGAFVKAAVAIAVALAPWGEVVLKALTGFLEIISNMDPMVLAALVTSITVLLLAAQAAYGVMTMVMAIGALSTLAIGPWILAIIVLASIIGGLYVKNEGFRKFMKKAWKEIGAVLKQVWENNLKPALNNLMDALGELWKEVLVPFFKWIGPIILWLAKKMLPIMGAAWGAIIDSIAWAIRKIMIPWIKTMWGAFEWMWEKVLKPVWGHMKKGWKGLMEDMKSVWKKYLKPVLDFITDTALPHLKKGFDKTIEDIGKAWDKLKRLVGRPIKFVLETVINKGLIGGYNKIANWVGGKELNDVRIPSALESYATGGVLPGYTPGRDVHRFVSPTAGRLELSGGEAIMRPEFTAAVGTGFVDQMNAIARSKGVKGVKQALGGPSAGYWMGGVLPLDFASSVSRHSGYEWVDYAADINGYRDTANPPAPVRAWKDGRVAHVFNGYADQHGRYGNHVMIDHGGQSSLYAHLSSIVSGILGKQVSAGTMLGRVGDTGYSFGEHLHFEIQGGNVDYGDSVVKGGKPQRSVPNWLTGIVKDPLATVKNWVTGAVSGAAESLKGNPFFNQVTKVPLMLGKAVTDKVWDIVPGFVKSAAGWAGDAADWAVGGVKSVASGAADLAGDIGGGIKSGASAVSDFLGFADGGVLPYNGTMKYDAGGYLPPGLTTVVNLTGKPEPVFTADQWANMGVSGEMTGVHYEPHFEGSNLTAEDVAADLNFTFRRIRRGGKYAGVGDQ